MSYNGVKTGILTFIGLTGSAISTLFGGWTPGLTTLCIFMVMDYATGMTVAAYFKNSPKTETGALSSNVGLKGIVKKAFILCLVLIAYRLDLMLMTTAIKPGAIIALCVNELISIGENLGLMGIKLPSIVKSAIDILNKKEETPK
jgi:toxin secretion/phage lysis holin